jgi:hypothetical protein
MMALDPALLLILGIAILLSLLIDSEAMIQKLSIPANLIKGVPVEKVETQEPICAFVSKT